MVTGSGGGGIVFTMRLDPATWDRYFGGSVAGGRGGGGFMSMLGSTLGREPESNAERGNRDRKNQSNFLQQLLVFTGIEKLLGTIAQQGSVSTTYLGAMGKMFGEAMDLLLIPLMPVLNLIMIGISLLVKWLVQSGTLADMQKTMQNLAGHIEQFISWAGDVAKMFKSGNFSGALAKILKDTFHELVATFTSGRNLKEFGKEGGYLALGGAALSLPIWLPLLITSVVPLVIKSMWNLGGLILGNTVGRALGGIFGGGGSQLASNVAVMNVDTLVAKLVAGGPGGTPIPGGGGGADDVGTGTSFLNKFSGFGALAAMVSGMWAAGQIAKQGTHGLYPFNFLKTGGNQGGPNPYDLTTLPAPIGHANSILRSLMLGGLGIGNPLDVIGSMLPHGGNGGNTTVHLTQNNSGLGDPKKLADDFVNEIQRITGHTLASHSYAGGH